MLIKNGERRSIATEFKKGCIPWNKGKMYKTNIPRPDVPKGKESWNWKGGIRKLTNGYIVQYVNSKKYVYQHRLVMEKFLGRKLNESEHVHHINGDKTDNRLENLELISAFVHNGMDIKLHPEKHYFFPKGRPPAKHKHGCPCNRCKNPLWKT